VGAKLGNADFWGANLYAADLTSVTWNSRSRTSFKCANFTNAIMTLESDDVETQGAVGLPTAVAGVFSRI